MMSFGIIQELLVFYNVIDRIAKIDYTIGRLNVRL